MKKLKLTLLILLAIAGMNIVGGAFAQTNATLPVASMNGEHSPIRSPQEIEKWQEKRKEQMAKHQSELHDKLKIMPAQEPAWKTFTQAMTPASVVEEPFNQDADKLSTPERMARSLEKMKHRENLMQTRLEAVKVFYAALTPEQQKIFDETHARAQKEMQERMARQMDKLSLIAH